jgi:hypothetical protein
MVEWLEHSLDSSRLGPVDQFYAVTKQYLDLTTSLALFSGHYAPSYRDRHRALGEIVRWMDRNGVGIPAEAFSEAARISFEFKQNPRLAFEWLWRSEETDLRAALRARGVRSLDDELAHTLRAVWRWEASRVAGVPAGETESDAVVSSRVYGAQDRVRSWASLLLDTQARPVRELWLRMFRLFPYGTPRSLVYVCAARLLEPEASHTADTLRWVRRHLPVIMGDCREEWSELADHCVRIWRAFLRRGGA